MYALASVLQNRGARQQPDDQSLRVGLLIRLFRNPPWLAGLACDVGGYVLQFVALGHGPIVVVQPLLVCGLLFALPLGAAWEGRRLARLDWAGALLVCVGLAVFLAVAGPAAGRNDATAGEWTILLLAVGAVAAALTALSLGADRRRRAVLLAAGAGILYGAGAALTKTSSHLLDHGLFPFLGHWQPYVLVLYGGVGMLLGQSAFQAGSLDYSLPTMTVLDPVVSVIVGAWVFEETIASSPLDISVEVTALVAMSVGVWLLARHEAARPLGDLPGQPVENRSLENRSVKGRSIKYRTAGTGGRRG
jgi:drug/metabolite transporter (DMT)-like permease